MSGAKLRLPAPASGRPPARGLSAPVRLERWRPGQGDGPKDRTRIERLVRAAQPVTPDTALRLGRVFDTTPEYWMNLQAQHDLSIAAIASRGELAAIRPIGGMD